MRIDADKWIKDCGIDFRFQNLESIALSGCTREEFLALIAQRLLLKQYTCFLEDFKTKVNYTCNLKEASKVFDDIKPQELKSMVLFKEGKTRIKDIIFQVTNEKYSIKDQRKDGQNFSTWFEAEWFSSLKSSECFELLKYLFSECNYEDKKYELNKNDWSKVSFLYGLCDKSSFLNALEEESIDTTLLTNSRNNIELGSMSDSLSSVLLFMKKVSTRAVAVETIQKNEDVILPVIGSLYLTTIESVENIKNGNKSTQAPYEPYSMFKIFDGTCMEYLLLLNQLSMTTYTMFKKMSL